MSVELIVCIGAAAAEESGGLKPADYISIVAVVIGAVGAYAGIQAFVVSDRSLRANILRDEFSAHRQMLQDNITALDLLLVPLRQTINPNMPIARIESNFRQVQIELIRRVHIIADEGQKIADRGLFKGPWATTFRKPAQKIEREVDSVLDDTKPEGIRRSSASDIVGELDRITVTARRMIDDTVRAPLIEGKFRWPWRKQA